MKRYILSILCLVMFIIIYTVSVNLTVITSSSRVESIAPIVVIDAGHGGVDGGAVASDGTNEKDINLAIAIKLNELMKLNGFSTVMTRTEDISIHEDDAETIRQKKVSDLKKRLSILDDGDALCMISIHQNIYSSSKYSGTQVFYGKNNVLSKSLAGYIQSEVVVLLQPDNKRVIKQTTNDIYLLYNAQKPCVMVECGFMSNQKELSDLKNDEYQTKMAFAVFAGFLEYYNDL
ncbi:MAG: N-acetylmuramoyl-L-alanine amidase [Acutalibacteraceae bacterium]|nr:N-acetylmuramoyl-L-alanine amidase [Acutalibacteraceae bacterium]